jgi:hypothetical protein
MHLLPPVRHLLMYLHLMYLQSPPALYCLLLMYAAVLLMYVVVLQVLLGLVLLLVPPPPLLILPLSLEVKGIPCGQKKGGLQGSRWGG